MIISSKFMLVAAIGAILFVIGLIRKLKFLLRLGILVVIAVGLAMVSHMYV